MSFIHCFTCFYVHCSTGKQTPHEHLTSAASRDPSLPHFLAALRGTMCVRNSWSKGLALDRLVLGSWRYERVLPINAYSLGKAVSAVATLLLWFIQETPVSSLPGWGKDISQMESGSSNPSSTSIYPQPRLRTHLLKCSFCFRK